MLEKFEQTYNQHHEYAREWKARTGGKVLGFFCTYVPEEIIYAAGVLPVRIIGSLEPQDVSEAHIAGMYCPFCRDCLAQGLKGKYDYLDGIVMSKSCMHMMQAYRSWTIHIPITFHHFVGMPALVGKASAGDFLLAELKAFKKALEGWLGKTITDADLDKGIEIMNTNRHLLRQIYDLRKPAPPKVTGTEATAMVISSMLTDKREHSQWLSEALKQIPQRQDGPKAGTRLMVLGSENHDLELFKLIEELGANVVIEDYCMGSRYFWNEAVPENDRLKAIAQRYINRPRCPLKDVDERKRYPHILNLVKEWNAQGVLLIQQKFCDPHEFDIPPINKFLKENGIITYFMELDVTMHKGSIRTRTEAFLEMLELEAV
ncbi:MAG: 2-hydroxyacyl-CoA dehydratase [Dehalococcoidia bacterium]|nr:2-hydroxyacyl-CoA dehydratase [Dehalococcoidia bacterium]